MADYQELVNVFIDLLKDSPSKNIPLGISNRHIHLSEKDITQLFGANYQLQKLKDLSQPGQYACKETLLVAGPRGVLEKVRVLGPARPETQIEILSGDGFKLGVKAPVRQSGDLTGTPGAVLIGPKGAVILERGVIIAQRHIHMTPADAQRFNVSDNQIVTLKLTSARGGTLANTVVRVNENFQLECHLDTEEANALGLTSDSGVSIIS